MNVLLEESQKLLARQGVVTFFITVRIFTEACSFLQNTKTNSPIKFVLYLRKICLTQLPLDEAWSVVGGGEGGGRTPANCDRPR